jgi:hypothetical protein
MDNSLKNKLKSVIDKMINEGSSSSNISNTNVAGAFSTSDKKGTVTIVTQKTIAASPNSVATPKVVNNKAVNKATQKSNDYESVSDEVEEDDDDRKSKSSVTNKVKLFENEIANSPKILPDPSSNTGEYNVNFDFTDFENKINAAEESAKEQFQEKLKQKVFNKKVLVRASKGQPGQPEKDYTINVSNVSVDYYYDRYVVVFKDEKDKEYFLKPGYKVKLLGQAEVKPTHKAPARINPPASTVPIPKAKPVAPAQSVNPIQKQA